MVLGVLRLAAEPNALAEVWLEVTHALARIRGTPVDDVSTRALSDELAGFTRELRTWLNATPVASADAAEVVVRAAAVVDINQLNGYVKSRHRGEDAGELLDSLTRRLADVMRVADNWPPAFVEFEAADAVSLLTIHRSKGLSTTRCSSSAWMTTNGGRTGSTLTRRRRRSSSGCRAPRSGSSLHAPQRAHDQATSPSYMRCSMPLEFPRQAGTQPAAKP